MSSIFDNRENAIQMVRGAYKKLKAYLYYDKTLVFAKKRLAVLESDREAFIKTLEIMLVSVWKPIKVISAISFSYCRKISHNLMEPKVSFRTRLRTTSPSEKIKKLLYPSAKEEMSFTRLQPGVP